APRAGDLPSPSVARSSRDQRADGASRRRHRQPHGSRRPRHVARHAVFPGHVIMALQLIAIVLGTFVSEDVTSIATGLLIKQGALPAWRGIAACALGIYLGDLGLWIAGRLLGSRALGWPRVAAARPAPRRPAR